MIWDQRNSTPVIQHFSPKLLGLSYQRQRAMRAAFLAVFVRAREQPSAPAPRRRIQHGVSSWNRSSWCFLPRRRNGICLKTKSRLRRETWFLTGFRPARFYFRDYSSPLPLFFLCENARVRIFAWRYEYVGALLTFSWLRFIRIYLVRSSFRVRESFYSHKEAFRIITRSSKVKLRKLFLSWKFYRIFRKNFITIRQSTATKSNEGDIRLNEVIDTSG